MPIPHSSSQETSWRSCPKSTGSRKSTRSLWSKAEVPLSTNNLEVAAPSTSPSFCPHLLGIRDFCTSSLSPYPLTHNICRLRLPGGQQSIHTYRPHGAGTTPSPHRALPWDSLTESSHGIPGDGRGLAGSRTCPSKEAK